MLKFSTSLLLFATQAYGLGRTLSDCLTVAALFDNTCTSTTTQISSITNVPSIEMSCSGSMRCPGGTSLLTYTTSNPCKWSR